MKIGRRILTGFAIVILINVVAAALIIGNVENVRNYYDGKKAMDSLAYDLKDSMLTENQFRSAYDTRLVVDFQFQYRNITRDINDMETSGVDYGEDVNFREMKALVQRYHDLILNNNEYLYNTENIWRTQDNIISSPGGLVDNSARIKERALELSMGKNASTEGIRYLYDMQQAERNYLSTHDASYLGDMRSLQNKTLAWSGNDPELADDIWRYRNNMEVLSGLYAHQANTSADIQGVVNTLEGRMDAIGASVNARFEETLARTIATIVIVLVLSIVSSAAISVLVTRSIARPIEALAVTSEKIARGGLKVKIVTEGNDEVSSLARSLRKMIIAMRERMEFNDALIRNILDAQVIVNNEGTLVYANGPTMKLFEEDFSAIVGQRYARFLEGLPDLMEIGSDMSCKCILLKKGGEKADVFCRLSVVKNGDGVRTGTMIMVKGLQAFGS